MKLLKTKTWLTAIVIATAQSALASPVIEQKYEIRDANGQEITYYILRNEEAKQLPALLVIDGSGCVGSKRDGFDQLMSPTDNPDLNYARIVVSKKGVDDIKQVSSDCSIEFKKAYSIENRVLDHLHVIQDIRRHADWWNGEFILYGWSDGGDIAAEVFALTTDATRLAFGGVGGGYTMREHFEDIWVCPESATPDRAACLQDLSRTFNDITANPTWTKTWSGEDNTYLAWSSRLDRRLTHLLENEDRPILMVHGALDFDAAPVISAQKLKRDLQGKSNFDYWEVSEMGHDMWSLDPATAIALETHVLLWLLNQEFETLSIIK